MIDDPEKFITEFNQIKVQKLDSPLRCNIYTTNCESVRGKSWLMRRIIDGFMLVRLEKKHEFRIKSARKGIEFRSCQIETGSQS